jgi:hypothetical protein
MCEGTRKQSELWCRMFTHANQLSLLHTLNHPSRATSDSFTLSAGVITNAKSLLLLLHTLDPSSRCQSCLLS